MALNEMPLDGSSMAISSILLVKHLSFFIGGVSNFGGATDNCRYNLLSSWPIIEYLSKTDKGRNFLKDKLRLCDDLKEGD